MSVQKSFQDFATHDQEIDSKDFHDHVESRHSALSHYAHSVDVHNSFFRSHPSHKYFAAWYDKYMVLVALLASTIVYLQASIMISNKSSENISMPSYILLLIVSLSVLIYGILWTDWVLCFSGVVSCVGSIIALVASLAYRPVSTSGPFAI